MYLWSIKELETSLRRREVSEREGLWYYAVLSVIALVVQEYSLWWGPRSGWLFYSELVGLLLLTIWGLARCWTENGGDTGDDILLKIVCLSVPIGLRTNLLGFIAGQFLYSFSNPLLNSGAFRDPALAYNYFSYAIFVSVAILYWKLVHRSLERIAVKEKNRARET